MTRLSAWLDSLTPAEGRWLALTLLAAAWMLAGAAFIWWWPV